MILDSIFSNERFVEKYDISRFVCGTTKEMGLIDYEESMYEKYTLEEYRNIDPAEIIESRSCDDIISGKLFYYFTLERHIDLSKNMVGITSIFQFEEIKKWAQIKQMETLPSEINVYPIYIETPLSDRIKYLISKCKTENDMYEVCADIVSERFEYRPVLENKVIGKTDPKVLHITNVDGINQMPKIYKEVKAFIERYCRR